MSRPPKPWFRKDRQAWFVTIRGRRYNLGPDKAAADERFYQLMANGPQPPARVVGHTVLAILDQFLEWTHQNRAPGTYEWYRKRCQSFAETISPALTVDQVKPLHVQQWIDQHPRWNRGSRRSAITALQRVFTWASKMGHIPSSPLTAMEKPPAGKRNQIITPSHYHRLLSVTTDDNFADVLRVCWETGCRPQEILRVAARHVDVDHARWVFTPGEAKVKDRPRIVYLPDTSMAITRRLMLKHPDGPLFRNSRGNPWKPYATSCQFSRLQARLGRQALIEQGVTVDEAQVEHLAAQIADRATRVQSRSDLKARARYQLRDQLARQFAPKNCLYDFRHSFATRLLASGVDALTVAILLGHANPSMVANVYQHLAHSPDYLLQQAKRAS